MLPRCAYRYLERVSATLNCGLFIGVLATNTIAMFSNLWGYELHHGPFFATFLVVTAMSIMIISPWLARFGVGIFITNLAPFWKGGSMVWLEPTEVWPTGNLRDRNVLFKKELKGIRFVYRADAVAFKIHYSELLLFDADVA